MANFAKISESNIVLNVVVVDDKDTTNGKGVEEEAVGQQFLEKCLNWPAHLWIQTSKNTRAGVHRQGGTPLRGNYAGIGYTWDPVNEIFISPKPYPSWVLNTTDARWHSPIGDAPALTAEQKAQNDAYTHLWRYVWNESGQSWDLTDVSS
jgi:hypothetical protein